MRGNGLRARLFRAIGLVVLICVALTIGVGLVLTRRAVEHATLQDLAHQADLVAAVGGDSVGRRTSPAEALAAVHSSGSTRRYRTDRHILPRRRAEVSCAAASRAGHA